MKKIVKRKSSSTEPKKFMKRKTREASYNMTQLQNDVIELAEVKGTIKLLQTREKELKDRVSKGMDRHVQADTSGHYTFPVTNAEGKKMYFQKQARTKVKLNPDRLRELLEERGMTREVFRNVQKVATEVTEDQVLDVLEKYAPHLVEEVEEYDESDLEQLVLAGEITDEEFDSVLDKDTTYAHTFVDAKHFEDEDQQE